MPVNVDINKCNGCGDCLPACMFDAIKLVNGKAQANDSCTLCGSCVQLCPGQAITDDAVAREPARSKDGAEGVWVFAEQRNGKLRPVAFELVSEGRKLADSLGTQLSAVCFGHNVENAESLVVHGADRVLLCDEPSLADAPEDIFMSYLVRLVRQYKPEILLAGATPLGRSFIPRVATVLETGLTADCTGLEIDPETRLLLQTRPTFGGNVMATIVCRDRRPQMATVRPRVFKAKMLDSSRSGQIVKVDFTKEPVTSSTALVAFVEDLSEKVKLEEADVIVSGGRGLGKPDNFSLITELAQAMGGAVGSSWLLVDEGWIPYRHQVGQTGKTVCPKLYVACGISGAVQHLAGMQTSDVIVAINEDPNAPIFEVATYGIVGDLFEVVPRIIEKLKDSR